MKIKLYWMEKCPHCTNFKKELAKLPKHYPKPFQIEHNHIPAKELNSVGITVYPTMAFFSNDNRLLKKLIGFHKVDDIIQAYREANRIEKIQDRYEPSQE